MSASFIFFSRNCESADRVQISTSEKLQKSGIFYLFCSDEKKNISLSSKKNFQKKIMVSDLVKKKNKTWRKSSPITDAPIMTRDAESGPVIG